MSDDAVDALRYAMAALSLQPIHLTKRAVEWLTKSPTVYGDFTYHEPVGYYACGAVSPSQAWRDMVHRLSYSASATKKCGVEDVRSAVLGRDYRLVQVAHSARRYRKVKLTMPTCDHCRVLLDMALQSSCPKTGTYPDVDDRGQLVWRKVMPDVYTAPAIVGRAPGAGPKDESGE